MISAQVVVALGESPWYGEACDHCARVGFLLVRSEDSIADAVEVEARLVHFPKIHALRLDFFPSVNERLLDSVEVFQQGVPSLMSCLLWCSSESNGSYTLAVIVRQVEFCGQSNVSVRRCGIFPCDLLVGANILPAVADTYVSNAHLPKCCRTC